MKCNKCSMSFACAVAKLQCRRIAASLPRCAVLQFSVCFFRLWTLLQLSLGLGRKDSWTGNAVPTADTSLLTWFILLIFGVRFVVRQKNLFSLLAWQIFSTHSWQAARENDWVSLAHHTHTNTLLAGRCEKLIKAVIGGKTGVTSGELEQPGGNPLKICQACTTYANRLTGLPLPKDVWPSGPHWKSCRATFPNSRKKKKKNKIKTSQLVFVRQQMAK